MKRDPSTRNSGAPPPYGTKIHRRLISSADLGCADETYSMIAGTSTVSVGSGVHRRNAGYPSKLSRVLAVAVPPDQRRNFSAGESNTISVPDSAADYAFCASGSQMLIWRVSGIRNRLSTKHTAGTAIG